MRRHNKRSLEEQEQVQAGWGRCGGRWTVWEKELGGLTGALLETRITGLHREVYRHHQPPTPAHCDTCGRQAEVPGTGEDTRDCCHMLCNVVRARAHTHTHKWRHS